MFLSDLHLDVVVVTGAMCWCPREQNQSKVVVSLVTVHVHSLSPKRKLDLGEGETGQLLNVVKLSHSSKETIRRKNEVVLYHETKSYFW